MTQHEEGTRVVSRRALIVGACAAGCLALGARIQAVNAGRTVIPERTYGLNEWLDIDDCYLGTEQDKLPGYGFMATGCAIMTPNEYLEAHSRTGNTKDPSVNSDRPCVAVVDLRIRNTGDQDMGVKFFPWQLVSQERPEKSYTVDNNLLSQAVPELNGSLGFRVLPGTEAAVVHFPFTVVGWPEFFHHYEEAYREDIVGRRFRLALTDLPERRMFVLEA